MSTHRTTSILFGRGVRRFSARNRPAHRRARQAWSVECLEGRALLSPFTVSNLDDGGEGSLRQAIVESNRTPGPNEIDFATGLGGTITLTSGQLTITDNDVTIVGPGEGSLSVSANGNSRVFQISSGVTATLSGMTITGGRAQNGGGVHCLGDLTLSSVLITNNLARGSDGAYGNGGVGQDAHGGGIYCEGGALSLINQTQVVGNHAVGGDGNRANVFDYGAGGAGGNGQGGGVYAVGGTLRLMTGAVVSSNGATGGTGGTSYGNFLGGAGGSGLGGGVYSANGTIAFANVTLNGNSACGGTGGTGGTDYYLWDASYAGGAGGNGQGGAVYAVDGTVSGTTVTISGNRAVGGDSQAGSVIDDIPGRTGGSGQGGGLFASHVAVTIVNGIITDNAAIGGSGGVGDAPFTHGGFYTVGRGGDGGSGQGGGVFTVSGTLNLTMGTISGNRATGGSAGELDFPLGGGSPGGAGGHGQGGGVFAADNTVTFASINLAENAATGGPGAGGYAGAPGGAGGSGQGGAVYAVGGNLNFRTDAIVSGNTAFGGAGGDGGDVNFYEDCHPVGDGGAGGNAQGAGLYVGSLLPNVIGVTLDVNTATGGPGGRGGGGPWSWGADGAGGSGQGGDVFSADGLSYIAALSVRWGTQTAVMQTADDGVRLLPLGRHTDLPWIGIQQVQVNLTEPVDLSATDVKIIGLKGSDYGVAAVSGSGTAYTITLAKQIDHADRVTLTIANPRIAAFLARLDVLPGDVNDDGVVNSQDMVLIRNATLKTGDPVMLGWADLDGNGFVEILDYTLARQKLGTRLP
jgi:hypothetical protein